MKPLTIFHAFRWRIIDIRNHLQEIKEAGYNAIQITPCQPHKEGPEWWTVYQPMGYQIGNDYGSKEDIKRLCEAANFLGIKIIADIILDHVASDNELCLVPHKDVDKSLTNNPYFWREKRIIEDWEDRKQVTNLCCGLPTLNLKNYDLQDKIIVFLNELVDIGVKGFRIDSGKNISTPEEDGNQFFIRVLNSLNDKEDLFIMAELIFLKNQQLLENYTEYVIALTTDDYKDQRKLCKFTESHDNYHHYKCTAWWDEERLIKEWEALANNYKSANLIFFARPLEDDYKDAWKNPKIIQINKTRL